MIYFGLISEIVTFDRGRLRLRTIFFVAVAVLDTLEIFGRLEFELDELELDELEPQL